MAATKAPDAPPMVRTTETGLTVLYDASCRACCRAKRWLETEPKWIAVEFIGARTPHARRRFPSVAAANETEPCDPITVIASDGSIYRHDKAWLICLWALRRYRRWALKLGTPELLPSARKFINGVSRNSR